MAAFAVTGSGWQWKTQPYAEQESNEWPTEGKHILAQYDDEGVVVYQAYCPEIADYAVNNQRCEYRVEYKCVVTPFSRKVLAAPLYG